MKKGKIYLKRLILFLVIVSLLIPTNLTTNAADKTLTEGDFTYIVIKDTDGTKAANIQGYTGSDENLVIPETLSGYKVIGITLLKGNKVNFKSITIPRNLKDIDEQFYYNQPGLRELESYIVHSDNKYFSSEDGVLFNKKKTILLEYPMGKKDVEYVEPSTVQSSTGLNYNPYLKKITFSSNKKYTKIVDGGYKNSNLEEITIPSNVKIIGEESFAFCYQLKKINFSYGLKTIWSSAFTYCTSLKEIKIPNSVFGIGSQAFSGCEKLETVKLSNTLKYIDRGAFEYNPKLKTVKIPDSVVKINWDAFDKLKGKTKLIMPSYMKKVYNHNKKLHKYVAKATVTSNGKTKNYKAENITKIKAQKKKITIKKGDTKKLSTIVYIKKKKKGILKNNILKFSSSKKKIAKVTSSGKVKALKKGTTVITVTLRTTKKSYKVKVKVK